MTSIHLKVRTTRIELSFGRLRARAIRAAGVLLLAAALTLVGCASQATSLTPSPTSNLLPHASTARPISTFTRPAPTATAIQPITPIPALSDYLDEIKAAWGSGDHEGALTMLDSLIAAEPGYGDALLTRAHYFHAMGDDLAAFQDASRVITLSPELSAAYLLRAELLTAAGEDDRALIDLNIALSLDPELAEAHLLRAGLLVDRDDIEGAIADLEAAITGGLGDADAFLQLGILYNQIEAFDLAKVALNRAIALGAGGYALRYQLAYASLFLAEYGTGLEQITLALAEQPESIEALSLRGTIYLNLGAWTSAERDFKVVLALSPETIDAYYGLAQAQAGAGRPEEAIASCEGYLAVAAPNARNFAAVSAFLLLLRNGAQTLEATTEP